MPGIEAAGKESLRTAVRGACLAAEKNWIAAHSYLEMAYRAGCRDPICLRAYALSLAALERLGEAESIFEQWHQIRPDDPEPRQYLQAIAQSRQASTSGQAAPATDEPTKDQRRVRVDQGESIVAAAPLETHVDGAPAAANLSSSESK
jgi:hypothetical protein